MEDAAVESGTSGKLIGRQVSLKDEERSWCRLSKDQKSIRTRLLPVSTDYLHSCAQFLYSLPSLTPLAERMSAIILLRCAPCLLLPNRLLLKINTEDMPFLHRR